MTNKKKLPYVPWFASDFAGATRGWPCCARLIYRELLDAQWDQGGLPNNPEQLREIVRVDAACFERGWKYVAVKFEAGSDGLLRNARLEAHRTYSRELAEKNSARASHAANVRWKKD